MVNEVRNATTALLKKVKSMSLPVVSVCIPVYNAEHCIADTIKSVLSQNWQDFELIILDDHSFDASNNIIKKFDDPRIRFQVNNKRLGAEANWNKSLSLARGRFIKLLCHDDLLYPECLSEQVKMLDDAANKNVLMVTCRRDIIDSNGKILWRRSCRGLNGLIEGNKIVRMVVRSGTNIIGEPSAVMFRAEVLKETGYFSARYPYVIDLEYWCRILSEGDLYCIPKALCAFRIMTSSWTMELRRSQINHFISLVQELQKSPVYNITKHDVVLGKINAFIQYILRQLFCLFVITICGRRKTI